MKVFVIVPAAGLGTRMGSPSATKTKKRAPSKQFKELGGIPILIHTSRKFVACPEVYEIIVALRKNEIAGFRAQLEKQYPEILNKRLQIVEGGEHRQDSVASALAAVAADSDDIVLVHDGVAHSVNSLYRHVRKNDSIVQFPISFLMDCGINRLFDKGSVVRMNPFQKRWITQLCLLRIKGKDAKSFLRPEDLS